MHELSHDDVAEGIDVTATIREISDSRGVVSALAVPNGVERNIPPLSTPPLVHLLSLHEKPVKP
jgi:hypothetical protein